MDPTIKCVVIEDEIRSLNLMTNLLKQIPEVELMEAFSDPLLAYYFMLEESPDLIFLDIKMPNMSGLQFIDKLDEVNRIRPFVFVTAYDDYLVDALHRSAIDYLLKPVSINQLNATICRARAASEKKNGETAKIQVNKLNKELLRFNFKNGFEVVQKSDIILLEAERNYTMLHMVGTRELLVTQNIGCFEYLLDDGDFLRIHRSSIINPAYFKKLNRVSKTCTLGQNGHEVKTKVSSQGIKLLDAFFS